MLVLLLFLLRKNNNKHACALHKQAQVFDGVGTACFCVLHSKIKELSFSNINQQQ